MQHIIAAIRLGTDPQGPLPPATIHRTLEDFLYCPKCDATYSLVVDYDWAVQRYFQEESRRHITLLRKAITHGHNYGHRITHFETNGVVVNRLQPEEPKPSVETMKPATRHIN